MRKRISAVGTLSAALLTGLFSDSCSMLGEAPDVVSGRISISFTKGEQMLTKAYVNLPDTSDFILNIADVTGNVIYDGRYGDCPETLETPPGTYNVKVLSGEFVHPGFDCPQFGDRQCVVVRGGDVCNVRLSCTQLNAGVKLNISRQFLSECPDASLFLKSPQGKLLYSYSEKRTAYFHPGAVSLVMSRGSEDETLMVRELEARQMLELKVEVLSDGNMGEGISMTVDTSRIWTSDVCVIGSGASGTTEENALSVAQTMVSAGQKGVWVCGYVVGGDLTSSAASFQSPFESRTCILLGPRSSTKDRNACVSVQLPAGDVRERLNLVDNPGMLGKRICLKGDVVESYYGLTGVKNVVEYVEK